MLNSIFVSFDFLLNIIDLDTNNIYRFSWEVVMDNFILLENVAKRYHMGEVIVNACCDISFHIQKGEFVVIVGPSGAGKTTVLNLIGGMDISDEGKIIIDHNDISQYSRKQLTTYRRQDIGFVFQFYNLISNLTALENVELACQICKNALSPMQILQEVGLSERMNNFPSQLSGGEQQRVAIARALAKNPKLLLCDEPTGALDDETGKNILNLLYKTNKEKKMTVLVITHNHAITPIADRVIHIRNGQVTTVIENQKPLSVSEINW